MHYCKFFAWVNYVHPQVDIYINVYHINSRETSQSWYIVWDEKTKKYNDDILNLLWRIRGQTQEQPLEKEKLSSVQFIDCKEEKKSYSARMAAVQSTTTLYCLVYLSAWIGRIASEVSRFSSWRHLQNVIYQLRYCSQIANLDFFELCSVAVCGVEIDGWKWST